MTRFQWLTIIIEPIIYCTSVFICYKASYYRGYVDGFEKKPLKK